MRKLNFLKTTLLLSVILISFNTTNAQVGIGVKGGLNLSKLTVKDDAASGLTNSSLMGPAFGLVFNFKANDVFSLQPELLYSTQGTKLGASFFGAGFTIKTIMNYAQLPVLAKLSFGSEKVRFFVNAGPYVGYFISGKLKSSGFGQDEEEKIDFSNADTKESTNRLDFGIAGGAGLAFKVGPGDIFVEGRYNFGLMDTGKGKMTKEPDYSPMKHRVINFSAGYILFFGNK